MAQHVLSMCKAMGSISSTHIHKTSFAVAILKYVILSSNLCLVSEVRWDHGACAEEKWIISSTPVLVWGLKPHEWAQEVWGLQTQASTR